MRRRYLLIYDIRDPKRLRAVHRVVREHGDFLQYSVYICDLSRSDLILLIDRLSDAVDAQRDGIAVFDLGDVISSHRSRLVHTIGKVPSLPGPPGTTV